jgi:peroxiredoxin
LLARTRNPQSAVFQEDPRRADAQILAPGTTAPDFELKSAPDKALRLSDLRGKPVVLAFYPADWSPVCGDQMALYSEMHEEFAEFGAQVVGISVDGVWCHAAFARDRKLRFPLLSDFEPKGAVSRAYGAYCAADGVSERALFVVDGEGDIRWSYLSPPGVNPGADGIFKALESLPGREQATRAASPRSSAPEARA